MFKYNMIGYSFLPFLMLIIYIILMGLGVYCLILFIKLAHRGIKALDIYIEKNKDI